MPLCRQLCLEVKRLRCQSSMSWALWTADFFHLRGVLSECPSSTQTLEKTNGFCGFGPLSEFSEFFLFFLFFPFRFFSPFFRGFRISAFSVFGVGAFPRKPSPSPGFIFLPPVPSQTQSHSPKTAKRSGKCNHAITCWCWFLPKFRERKMRTKFFCTTFWTPPGVRDIPAKFPGHPGFLSSKPKEDKVSRAARSFRPPPLRVEDPHPTGRSPDPKT